MNPNLPLKLSDTSEVKCSKCFCNTFTSAVLMRKVSPLLSPNGKEAFIPVETMACIVCGNVNLEFMPEELRNSVIKQTIDVSGIATRP